MSDVPEQQIERGGVSTLAISIVILLIILTGSIIGGVSLYGTLLTDESARGLQVGNIPIGGMSEGAVTEFLTDMTEKLLDEPMVFQIETASGTEALRLEPLVIVSADGTTREIVRFDVDTAVRDIMQYGKKQNRFAQGLSLLKIRFENPSVYLSGVEVDKVSLLAELQERTLKYSVEPITASINITGTHPIQFDITPSEDGIGYDFSTIEDTVSHIYGVLKVPEISMSQVIIPPDILESDLLALEPQIDTVLHQFPIQIVYIKDDAVDTWTLYPERAATLLKPKRNGAIYLGVHEDRLLEYLADVIAPDVEVAPQEARFTMNNGKVSEFQVAETGIGIATSTMVERMELAIKDRNTANGASTSTLELATVVVEPIVSTDDVNDLGITELLGVGISDFSGSPANRIKNIRNAVDKLNGLIIAPGEEFSTIDHTKPYTIEGGYFPELVIKGDSIEPEIGGGLCQIGTTLFRMAMNSGLTITERRNHSLVVNHYNDLVNGLPGTDATVYDPAPDLKFKNDTEHYILIQTEMNMKDQMLRFYLWGTSDGRSGSYTHPVVNNWITPGEPVYTETTKLAPGETQCQNAFKGANTEFTYTRTLADGTVEDTVYTSHYRALPKICLIGVENVDTCDVSSDGTVSCTSDESPPEPTATPSLTETSISDPATTST